TILIGVAPAWAENRPFKREDYETYFAKGRFASFSPFYQSTGVLEVLSSKSYQLAGASILEQATRTLDVSVNYDAKSSYGYYKIITEVADRMIWNDRLNAYVYDYTRQQYDADTSKVWESKNTRTEISADDRSAGDLHRFYHDVDRRAGLDANQTDRIFRNEVVGTWVWRCDYVHTAQYDVRCTASRQGNARVETFFYHRLDLVS
ncbi:MAG TPA: hypothetical protein VG942_16430, partial [Hyphomonadaceae bacterium]|nr:hypothetical protein [Hyphomonadaceae bacterium]